MTISDEPPLANGKIYCGIDFTIYENTEKELWNPFKMRFTFLENIENACHKLMEIYERDSRDAIMQQINPERIEMEKYFIDILSSKRAINNLSYQGIRGLQLIKNML